MVGEHQALSDQATSSSPRFCPRCARSRDPRATLCPECGETLKASGYCTICERFLTQPVDSLCPKHDIPLIEGPPSHEIDPSWGPVATWVVVDQFTDAQTADAPRIRLEAEGIPTFIDGERMGSRAMYHVATGGVKLRVPAALAADARVILAQSWSLPTHEDDYEQDCDELIAEPTGIVLNPFDILAFLGVIALLVIWAFFKAGGR